MCYPSPGPRCSNHAYKEYVEAQQRFAVCVDAEEKLILGNKLEEKRAAYESTPRGQNELRRQADSTTGLEREQLLARFRKGVETRVKQFEDYNLSVARKDTSFTELMHDKEYTRGRYQDASGIALLYLTSQPLDKEFHIENAHTITANEKKLFILPEKYQGKWAQAKQENGIYTTTSSLLKEVLNSTLDTSNLSAKNQQKSLRWFVELLESESYAGFAAVNRRTQDVAVMPLSRLGEAYDISLKVKKRLGGTTNYAGELEPIKALLKGTPFEKGNLLQPAGTNKTVVYGILPQAKEDCVISPEFYLAWHVSNEGTDGYFEVRRRHSSSNFDILVCLKAKRQLTVSAISKEVQL